MATTVKSVSISADIIAVYYSDNGTSDTITKSFTTPSKGIEWLKLWYSDTGNGVQLISEAIAKLEKVNATEYFINGDKVSEEAFERDANDNFNAGISYTVREEDNKVIMEYSEV